MAQFDFNEKFRQRTQLLSLQVIDWYSGINHQSEEIQIMGEQLIRSVTTTASGFRNACRARSREERFKKLAKVVEASDQTLFWLELLKRSDLIDHQALDPIYQEALEVLKVMATHRKNLKSS